MFILDTDFIYAFFDSRQSTHYPAINLIEKYGEQETLISNLVEQELATVISYKIGYTESKEVIKNLELFQAQKYYFSEKDTQEIWKVFWSFKNKKVSFVDCSNLYLSKKLKYKIASFDKFYPTNTLLK